MPGAPRSAGQCCAASAQRPSGPGSSSGLSPPHAVTASLRCSAGVFLHTGFILSETHGRDPRRTGFWSPQPTCLHLEGPEPRSLRCLPKAPCQSHATRLSLLSLPTLLKRARFMDDTVVTCETLCGPGWSVCEEAGWTVNTSP